MLILISAISLNYLIVLYLVKDNGPADVFMKFRKAIGVNVPITDIDGDIVEYESDGTLVADMITCHRCFGFWSGLTVGLIWGLGIHSTIIVIAGSVLLHE